MKNNLKPAEIVKYLDRYIIGQEKAKKAVAIALRNRWRREQLEPSLKKDIIPNNIILIGPTGIGKTEISRRLAELTQSPFIKVEASKYTEVGYIGRDVESIIRDLSDVAYSQRKLVHIEKNHQIAEQKAIEKIMEHLKKDMLDPMALNFYTLLEDKKLDNITFETEIDVSDQSIVSLDVVGTVRGTEELAKNFQDFFETVLPKQKKNMTLSVPQAFDYYASEFLDDLIDHDQIVKEAIYAVEENGIVFIDEIDKIVDNKGNYGPDISREGVQRDLLPIIEGTAVMTKYGLVHTDHVLFIAAGAFHVASPSDLIPEFQGRFPIRVEMDELGIEDFQKILTLPKTALLKQYQALFKVENIELKFTPQAIIKTAEMAFRANEINENIGARRLHTVLSILLEDYLFDAPDIANKKIRITDKEVDKKLKHILSDDDLSRYIL